MHMQLLTLDIVWLIFHSNRALHYDKKNERNTNNLDTKKNNNKLHFKWYVRNATNLS